jgi:hypothetical protein
MAGPEPSHARALDYIEEQAARIEIQEPWQRPVRVSLTDKLEARDLYTTHVRRKRLQLTLQTFYTAGDGTPEDVAGRRHGCAQIAKALFGEIDDKVQAIISAIYDYESRDVVIGMLQQLQTFLR